MFQPDCPKSRVLARLYLEKYNVRLKCYSPETPPKKTLYAWKLMSFESASR
jgi:hypothetical protein